MDWGELATDLNEFQAWARKVGDYHALHGLQRFWAKKKREADKLAESEKKRFVEAD